MLGIVGLTAAVGAGVPSEKGDPPPEFAMRKYVVGFLFRGPWPTEKGAADALQRAHLANNARLHKEGKLILAGPFLDNTDLRGIFVFDTDSVDSAREWCDSDPAVKAGSLRVELHPWYSAKGIGIVGGVEGTT